MQASTAREKNRILSIMFQRMSEMNDDVLQQISLLAPFLEQHILHLDAPSTALLFLHSAILLNPELEFSSNEEQRPFLSAIIAALKQQTVVLTSLLTGTSSVDFSCYESQCAASTVMALETYLHSGEDLSLVFGCITDPILLLLQEETATKVIGDKKTTKGKGEKHLQRSATKFVLDEGLLKFYVTDGIEIANVLCGNDSRYYVNYYGESRLDERLSLLKSPVAELMKNSNVTARKQKPPSLLPSLLTRLRLKKEEPEKSTLKWQTAVDLQLFLLRVDLFSGDYATSRHFLLRYVRQMLYAIHKCSLRCF